MATTEKIRKDIEKTREKIAEQQANTVQVLVYDECVFAVLKEDLAAKGESLYANYRSSCIKDLYSEAAESKTAEAVAALGEAIRMAAVTSLPTTKPAGSLCYHSTHGLCFSDGANWIKLTGTVVT